MKKRVFTRFRADGALLTLVVEEPESSRDVGFVDVTWTENGIEIRVEREDEAWTGPVGLEVS